MKNTKSGAFFPIGKNSTQIIFQLNIKMEIETMDKSLSCALFCGKLHDQPQNEERYEFFLKPLYFCVTVKKLVPSEPQSPEGKMSH